MTHVVPAIIPKTVEQLKEEIKKVSNFAPVIQIDISDGVFTPVKTWPYNGRDEQFFEMLKTEEIGWPEWEDVDFEVHLMVQSPEEVVGDWIKTGATSIVAHVESTNNFQKFIDICRVTGVSIGVAIKPNTDIELLEPFAGQVDFIQVMGSDELGRHGVELDSKAIEMISSLRKSYPERIIAIDIGVTTESAETLVSAGANKLISGGEILNAESPVDMYRRLEEF